MLKLGSKLIDIILVLAVVCPASFLVLVVASPPREGNTALLRRDLLINADINPLVAGPLFELFLAVDRVYYGGASLEEARTLKDYAVYLQEHGAPGEADACLRRALGIETNTYESRTHSVTGFHYLDAKELVHTSSLLAKLLSARKDQAGAEVVLGQAWRIIEKEKLFEETEICRQYILVLQANGNESREAAVRAAMREWATNLDRTRDAYIASLLNVPADLQARAAGSYLVEYYETMAIDLNHSGRLDEAETYIEKKNRIAAVSGSLANLDKSNVDFVSAEKALMLTWRGQYERALSAFEACARNLNDKGMAPDEKCIDCLYLLPVCQAQDHLLQLLGRHSEEVATRELVDSMNEFLTKLKRATKSPNAPIASGDPVMAFDGRLWRCSTVVSIDARAGRAHIRFCDRRDKDEWWLPMAQVKAAAPYGIAACAEITGM